MERDAHQPAAELPPEKRRRLNHRQFQQQIQTLRRLIIAVGVWLRRYRHEQTLTRLDTEPRFRVSWEKLCRIAVHPGILAGGFGRFMHRLHRLAESETDEAVRAYHAVSKVTRPPEPAAANEPPREES
ncbi:MAG: hypothetical protein HY421_02170 [Candidatus Kerfeldbacteria bacterium]|nr:hypothetical protein [Candidatus Kerfeldbacteria bacterium]